MAKILLSLSNAAERVGTTVVELIRARERGQIEFVDYYEGTSIRQAVEAEVVDAWADRFGRDELRDEVLTILPQCEYRDGGYWVENLDPSEVGVLAEKIVKTLGAEVRVDFFEESVRFEVWK